MFRFSLSHHNLKSIFNMNGFNSRLNGWVAGKSPGLTCEMEAVAMGRDIADKKRIMAAAENLLILKSCIFAGISFSDGFL